MPAILQRRKKQKTTRTCKSKIQHSKLYQHDFVCFYTNRSRHALMPDKKDGTGAPIQITQQYPCCVAQKRKTKFLLVKPFRPSSLTSIHLAPKPEAARNCGGAHILIRHTALLYRDVFFARFLLAGCTCSAQSKNTAHLLRLSTAG